MARKKKILLLSMPFGALERQALGISILKARLHEEGVPCDLRYLTFRFAEMIGGEDYHWIMAELPHTAFAGDWLFTAALHGPNNVGDTIFIREVLRHEWQLDEPSIDRLLKLRAMVEPFLAHCLATIPWEEYAVVGFTSTFDQNIASLALAKRVKEAHPEVNIAFGGGNWEDEMGRELHRRFPFVDYACPGEADVSFPALAKLLLAGRCPGKNRAKIRGLIYRENGKSVYTGRADLVKDLDQLPYPDYSDYFRDYEETSAASFVIPTILFEGSRGCWWGQRVQCRFCGLNGNTMAYRAKSGERALEEIKFLSDRWGTEQVQAVDNVIHMSAFKDLLPDLAKLDPPLSLFFEIRANLSHSQVRKLGEAGVDEVQPGIESLSNHVLRVMRKGTTALQNIQLLKWLKESDVHPSYNILYGFPGETQKDYDRVLELLPAIRFLDAPTGCGPIRLDRFSPYFNDSESFGLRNLRPLPPYKFLYPFGVKSQMKIAYYFNFDYSPEDNPTGYADDLIRYCDDWKENPEKGTLSMMERPDGRLVLLDTRSDAVRKTALLSGLDKEAYEYCDRARPLKAICRHLKGEFPKARLCEKKVRGFLDALVANRYMVSVGDFYLSLALEKKSMPAPRSSPIREREAAPSG